MTLRIGVIGPTGFGGSHLCIELLQRGHTVIGLSRHPEQLGVHEHYIPRSMDIDRIQIGELAKLLNKELRLDVLISEYGPHTSGHAALTYMPFLETIRKIILAVKTAAISYFIMVGGTGSLHIPDRKDPHETAVDNPDFWIAYRRALADSEAHTVYMEERLGPLGRDLRRYRNVRIAMKKKQNRDEQVSAEDRQFVVDYEAKVRANDDALAFIRAGRTSYLFFDGNTSFRWTYVSPSARYRPGRRTGRYETMVDELPLSEAAESRISTDSNALEGRLLGISAPDLAIAIADEAENQRFVGRHWTAYADLSDDAPGVIYARLAGAN